MKGYLKTFTYIFLFLATFNLNANVNREELIATHNIKIEALLLFIIFLLVFWIVNLYRKNKLSEMIIEKADLIINSTARLNKIEELQIKVEESLLTLINNQLELLNNSPKESEDHSLVLKVADELTRIEKNLSKMSKETKGIKQLFASVKRIKDNFEANGYEIVDMLGKEYNEGMKVSATFIPDESLDEGVQIITRIIKPQVNYKGLMIQSAQIEVSQGE